MRGQLGEIQRLIEMLFTVDENREHALLVLAGCHRADGTEHAFNL